MKLFPVIAGIKIPPIMKWDVKYYPTHRLSRGIIKGNTMAQKRHQSRHDKHKQAAPKQEVKTITPEARMTYDMIFQGGEDYIEDNLERILFDSSILAEEPEFVAITFDNEKIKLVTPHILAKYETRLRESEKEGEAQHQEVVDEMYIEIIDQCATPPFRVEVRRRLKMMRERLETTTETNKLEMTLVLEQILRMKDLPWGICNLIAAIFHRTVPEVLEELDEEGIFFDRLEEILPGDVFNVGLSSEDILKMIAEPGEKILNLEKISSDPVIMQRMDEKIGKSIDALYDALQNNEISFDLFSPEELEGIISSIGVYIEKLEITKPSEEERKAMAGDFFQQTRRNMASVLTQERLHQMKKDLEDEFRILYAEQSIYAVGLLDEISWLEDLEVEENDFLLLVLLGQVMQIVRHESQG